MSILKQLEESRRVIGFSEACPLGVVLGSGLGDFSDRVDIIERVKYADIPHMVPPTVAGHHGELIIGRLNQINLVILKGRVHRYEGHTAQQVVYPVRLLKLFGVETVVLSNAAGGLDSRMCPGDLMMISDQINMTGDNPLMGPNDDELGPRFPDMSDLYSRGLRHTLRAVAQQLKIDLHEGVYCGVLGPSYETPAEIQFFKSVGAKAVGMSTVLEAIAAAHAGMKVLGISCITNLAAGLDSVALDHKDVQKVAAASAQRFADLMAHFVMSNPR